MNMIASYLQLRLWMLCGYIELTLFIPFIFNLSEGSRLIYSNRTKLCKDFYVFWNLSLVNSYSRLMKFDPSSLLYYYSLKRYCLYNASNSRMQIVLEKTKIQLNRNKHANTRKVANEFYTYKTTRINQPWTQVPNCEVSTVNWLESKIWTIPDQAKILNYGRWDLEWINNPIVAPINISNPESTLYTHLPYPLPFMPKEIWK